MNENFPMEKISGETLEAFYSKMEFVRILRKCICFWRLALSFGRDEVKEIHDKELPWIN